MRIYFPEGEPCVRCGSLVYEITENDYWPQVVVMCQRCWEMELEVREGPNQEEAECGC